MKHTYSSKRYVLFFEHIITIYRQYFDATRRVGPPCHIEIYVFFDAMRTGNPPCHVCIIHNERGTLSPSRLSQFGATRRNFPLIVSVQCYLMRQGVFLLPVMSVTQFDMTRGKNPLRCIRSILFDTTERYLTQQGGGSLSIIFMQLSSMR